MAKVDRGSLVYSGWLRVWKNLKNNHEVVETTDSVAFLVYIRDLDQVVLLRQPREPMASELNPRGFIVEVSAGRFDVDLLLEHLIAKEALEELGAQVDPVSDILVLNNHRPVATSPGVLTEKQYLALVTIDSSKLEKADRIYGVPGEEEITRLFVPVDALADMVFDDLKTFALVRSFLTYLRLTGRQV